MRSKVSTEAIVLSTTKYKETSLIFNVLTPELGLTGLIANGVRKQKPKYRPALFQVFNILDINIDYLQKRDLQRFTDLKYHLPLYSIHSDAGKSSTVFFLSELFNKCVRYPHEDKGLFYFLKNSIITLENLKQGISTFHLQFMLKMFSILGFHIEKASQITEDVKNAKLNIDISEGQAIEHLNKLIKADYGDSIKIIKCHKHALLDLLLSFFQIHSDKYIKLNSLDILKKIL